MATLNTLGVDSLSLRGAGTEYNSLSRVFRTKAEADAALASGDWTPVAGRMNLCVTGDQGVLRVDQNGALVVADDATRAYIDSQVTALVGDAPAILDSMGELADAIAEDPNFFSTMTSANNTLQNSITAETARATAAETSLQADVDQNEADADSAIAALQADVDQNETDSDTAIAAETTRATAAEAAIQADVDANEASANADIATETARASAAEAAIQADVDANEASANADINAEAARAGAAEAAIQSDVDQNEADADAAIAAVQADVDANETAANAAIAAVQADVDANETAANAAIAAVQADVDQNETDSDAALATERARIDAILSGASADTDTFAEVVALVNSVDTANDAAFAGYVTSNDAAVAAVQADVDQNEADADAAIAAVQADVDSVEAAAATARTNLQTLLQNAINVVQADADQNEADADAAIATKFDKAGGVLTGSLVVAKSFPDLHLKANDEKRVLFSDAGGGSTAAIKHVSSTLDFFAGGIAAGNKEMSIGTDGVDVSALKIAGTAVTATATELNYVDGVTSNVQTQLDAIQADVNTNESDADTAIAAVQADVDANEAAALAARNAIQADVDQNETDSDAAIAVERGRIDAILSGADADKDTFAEIVTLINSVDTTNDNAFAGYVTSNNAAVAAVQADVDQNESDGDAADVALGARIDTVETEIDTARTNIYTALGQAEAAQNMGTFTGSTLTDNTTVRALLQELETDTESRLSKLGGTLTGDLTLRKSDGSAVALVLSRQDHADMSCQWKVTPSYVSSSKEVLSVLANGQVVAHFDERQRFAINMTDPDYTLDVGGDGHFSTNLVVGGNITCDSGNLHAQTLTLGNVNINATGTELNYVDGVTSNIQTQLDAKLAAETITMTAFKAVVAASSDFADFKSRVAAL